MYGEKTVNPSIRIYANKIENRIVFKIKTGYYLVINLTQLLRILNNIYLFILCLFYQPNH